MNKLPLAKTKDIVVQTLGKEILIYDLNTHKAYNLNETSSIVYQACDGRTFFTELKAKNKLTDEIIYLALDELKKENLIEESDGYDSPFEGMSRREVIRKVGFASMIALPVISSLVAPTAAMAQSPEGLTCSIIGIPQGQQGTCPSGQRCVGGFCSPCIASGEAVPGGCSGSTFRRCCSSSCIIASSICI
jgi:hypothetical protein